MTTAFSDEALGEASTWYARLHGGDATAEDHLRLGDWLAARPENQLAYDFVTETGRMAITVGSAARGRRVPGPAWRVGAGRRPWVHTAGLAAAAAIVLGIGIATHLPSREVNYATAVGEIRTVTLSDGSVLVLNGATKLRVRFSRTARDVDLDSGQFFVAVGKDAVHPFRVHAAGRTIEDVGTAFDVDTDGGEADVAVSDGTVMISNAAKDGDRSNKPVVLNRGQALTFTADRLIGVARTLAPQDVGTWRVGILSYDDSPLEWLVADLNRRFDGRVAIRDPALAAMPVTLTLKLHDRGTTIGTLEKLLPVRAITNPDGSIDLVSAKS